MFVLSSHHAAFNSCSIPSRTFRKFAVVRASHSLSFIPCSYGLFFFLCFGYLHVVSTFATRTAFFQDYRSSVPLYVLNRSYAMVLSCVRRKEGFALVHIPPSLPPVARVMTFLPPLVRLMPSHHLSYNLAVLSFFCL